MMNKIVEYMTSRALEQGSLSAYAFAIFAAVVDELPLPGKILMASIAVAKFHAHG